MNGLHGNDTIERASSGKEAVRNLDFKSRLYVYWVYVKSFGYSLKNFVRKRQSTDRFIYK